MSDYIFGKYVNDCFDFLLFYIGIVYVFFIYLIFIYSLNMLYNDKEKYWELVKDLFVFKICLKKF